MTGREFAIGLAKRIAIFIVIPALIVLYGMIGPSGQGTARFGVGMVVYFIGIPLWIIAAAVMLWRLFHQRLRSLGVPSVFAIAVVPFVLADWRFFMWLFRPFYAPFLMTALLLIIALMFWPDRTNSAHNAQRNPKPLIAIGIVVAVQTLLALMSIAGSVTQIVSFSPLGFRLQLSSAHYALWCNVPIAAVLIWALIDSRREPPSFDDGYSEESVPDPRSIPSPSPSSGPRTTFGQRPAR